MSRPGAPVAAVVLDFDGLIVDTETPIFEAWLAAFRRAAPFDAGTARRRDAPAAALVPGRECLRLERLERTAYPRARAAQRVQHSLLVSVQRIAVLLRQRIQIGEHRVLLQEGQCPDGRLGNAAWLEPGPALIVGGGELISRPPQPRLG